MFPPPFSQGEEEDKEEEGEKSFLWGFSPGAPLYKRKQICGGDEPWPLSRWKVLKGPNTT